MAASRVNRRKQAAPDREIISRKPERATGRKAAAARAMCSSAERWSFGSLVVSP
jgi:hypothetical protein